MADHSQTLQEKAEKIANNDSAIKRVQNAGRWHYKAMVEKDTR